MTETSDDSGPRPTSGRSARGDGFYRRYGKRWLDVVGAGIGLLVLWPVILLLAALILVKLGRPVFFVQERPGLQGQPFRLIKLRTMRDLRSPFGQLLPDKERLTPFGKWMRAMSLDELPELWNVLKGDMSLVGPRPLLMEYLPLYTPEQARRHELKPGLTGLAQVKGRNALSWTEKFLLDVWYIDRVSLRIDVIILLKTFCAVINREGINHTGSMPMPRFRGGSEK